MSKTFHKLVQEAKHISKYNTEAGFQFVREGLRTKIPPELKAQIDIYLECIANIHATLGIDSTDMDRKRVWLIEQEYMKKIKALSPEYYESIKPNDH